MIYAFKIAFSSVLLGLSTYFSLQFFNNFYIFNLNIINIFIQGALAGLVGILVYLLLAYFLRIQNGKSKTN